MPTSHLDDQLTEFLLYTTPSGKVTVEVFLQNETIWLTQDRMAEIFGVDRTVITKHLKNIYKDNELQENSTSAKIAQVQTEGNRQVNRTITVYNLDAIIAVGYRVNSKQATQFRIWTTQVLKEYIIKGFTLHDEGLKNGKYFGKDYFHELLERVRSIRASERRVYQQLTDLFAECSIDYDPTSQLTKTFYATVQNKFHYAITRKTAAEIVYQKANKDHPFMGLKTWKNAPHGRILQSDTTIAKNYLDQQEIKKLERTISSYFDYIENQLEMEKTFTMEELSQSINKFLDFNDFEILDGKGTISQTQAQKKARNHYQEFNKTQVIESDFDREVKQLLEKTSSS